jgi:hypothetical protein
MTRVISPPLNQLDKLRQPLTPGEWIVFNFFNDNLRPEWEIYIQPHLNGLRPDFVLLNPNVGVAVFEVKDWNLNAMDYQVKTRPGKSPELYGRKDGKTFSMQKDNPVNKIARYKDELFKLYCPRLDQRFGQAVITAGIIFPFAFTENVLSLFDPCLNYKKHEQMLKYPNYWPIVGGDLIQAGVIENVFPEHFRKFSDHMSEALAQDVRRWLVEPDFSSIQREPLELDSNQLSLVRTRTTSGYRRIKGPAGSGKSLIIAARAAELIGQGKEVLVISYNITLLHYLQDIAVRWPISSGKTRSDVTWLNFHAWCKRVCEEADYKEEYDALWSVYQVDQVLNYKLPELVSRVINQDSRGIISRYDAILVDEGQDFLPNWWNVLRKVCRANGEMLLVADATQDIYETAKAWTDDAMVGAGFPGGRWAELKISYRMPVEVLKLARNFAINYLPKGAMDLPVAEQVELDFYPCELKWIHTTKDKAVKICSAEVLLMSAHADPKLLAITDITFLTGRQDFGYQVVGEIGAKGVRAVHTYSADKEESRRKKMGFYMGSARIKATTIHSFKGWESKALVIYIGDGCDKKTLVLIYTGLTRLKRSFDTSYLTIVSCSNELKEYGRTWPNFYEL